MTSKPIDLGTMKRLILFIATGLLLSPAFSQTLERQVIGSHGLSVEAVGIASLNSTVGETVIFSKIAPSVQLTQGFHQSELDDMTNVVDLEKNLVKAIAFPNPATNLIQVRSNLAEEGIAELRFSIIDLHGKEVFSGTINSTEAGINVGDLAASSYTLVLSNTAHNYRQHIRFTKV